ncbi:hypothetical protein C8R44DRAFT_980578 [Mycena epipterygia]|nr:hypothetical protein C8R44DRAFT_980578 [Mycena epipterygia]
MCQYPVSLDSYPPSLSSQRAMASVEVYETCSTRTDMLHEEPKSEYHAMSSQAANLYHEYVPLLAPQLYQVTRHTEPIVAPLPLLYSARSKEVLASLITPVQPSRSSQPALRSFADSYSSFFLQRPLKSDISLTVILSQSALGPFADSKQAYLPEDVPMSDACSIPISLTVMLSQSALAPFADSKQTHSSFFPEDVTMSDISSRSLHRSNSRAAPSQCTTPKAARRTHIRPISPSTLIALTEPFLMAWVDDYPMLPPVP